MAIGTTAALIGSAVIGAGASAISSSKNNKAINAATDAQTQSNDQSIALQSQIYGQNKETLSPYVNRGNVAGNQINALLGLGGTAQTTQQPAPNLDTQRGGPGPANYYGVGDASIFGDFSRAELNDMYPQVGTNTRQNAFGMMGGSRPMPGVTGGFGGGTFNNGGTPATPVEQGQTAEQAAGDAFDIFRNSTGYQFRVNEGVDALNSGYAGSGLLQSGAALKGLDDYRQNMASAEFGNYMGYLGQQQGAGLGAAGAQAGVGVQYANNVSNLNSQNANALANAAVAKANNSNALIGGIAGGVGSILGGFGR